MNTGKQSKTILNMSGNEIHNLEELRENFNGEEAEAAFKAETLSKWLDERYYEKELLEVNNLYGEDEHLKTKLAKILGITSMEKQLTDEELAKLEAKRAVLREANTDDVIISKVHLVAFNQEELAELIDKGEKVIYLFKESFSIPIRKTGITYIGLANPKIGNCFTAKQYLKAGIKLENIETPQEPNPNYVSFAKEAAKDAGYDEFGETHSFLANYVHNQLKMPVWDAYTTLVATGESDYHEYKSESECKQALKKRLKTAYDTADSYFIVGDDNCFAKVADSIYGQRITEVFTTIIDDLLRLCKMQGKDAVAVRLSELVNNAPKVLSNAFQKELSGNSEYYAMYKFSYFLEQADVVENEGYYVSDEDDTFFRLLEKVVAYPTTYHYENSLDAIWEMEKDLNKNRVTFFKAAHSEYERYVQKIEELVQAIGKDLPAMDEGEDVNAYLKRIANI